MKEKDFNRLKEVLGIHTCFGQEDGMADYLCRVLTSKGYKFEVDKVEGDSRSIHYNIYVTKGEAELYPCFISHIDTVHRINQNMVVFETIRNGEQILTGIDSNTGKPSGIGGDDKCGVFLCLEMLDRLDNVKVAFFGGEEIGMQGSKRLNLDFFSNVCYAIQFDSPQGNTMSMSLNRMDLFEKKEEFGNIAGPLITEAGITQWCKHPYTDIYQVVKQCNISGLNLAAGYHRYHLPDEYVVVDEVQNSLELGLRLVEALGTTKRYERGLTLCQQLNS